MPVNVAMEEPGPRVVGSETECYIVACISDIYNVAANGIHIIICWTSSDADNIEDMSVKVERMLHIKWRNLTEHPSYFKRRRLTFIPPGMETSTVEFFGSV